MKMIKRVAFTIGMLAGFSLCSLLASDRLVDNNLKKTPVVPEILGEIVEAHGFVPSANLVHATNALWLITSRPVSNHALDQLTICITAGHAISVKIIGYQRGPSDWAIVGPLFRDYTKETQAIEKEIRDKLNLPAK